MQNPAQGWSHRDLPWVNGRPLLSTLKELQQPRRRDTVDNMAQSLAKILIHAVFSTKDRRPFLKDDAFRGDLHAYLGGILKARDNPPLAIGGIEDHVHLLFTLSRTSPVAAVIKEVKRSSSNGVKSKALDLSEFAWQNGYGAFSIGASQVDAVRAYIAKQEEHHRRMSFHDEFRELCARYGVELDERYAWD